MKKLAWGVALGVLGLALTAQAARKMSFGTVEPVNTQSVFELPQLSREALEAAMDVHNMMVEVRRLKTDRTKWNPRHAFKTCMNGKWRLWTNVARASWPINSKIPKKCGKK